MNKFALFITCIFIFCTSPTPEKISPLPDFMRGYFEDDYGITYSISDSLFSMGEHTKIHIREWNPEKQFFIGQNDSSNIYDALLFSRIDWIKFEGMDDFKWGFCMSAYNEPSLDSARVVSIVDRESPETGCNGYPFSRMNRLTN